MSGWAWVMAHWKALMQASCARIGVVRHAADETSAAAAPCLQTEEPRVRALQPTRSSLKRRKCERCHRAAHAALPAMSPNAARKAAWSMAFMAASDTACGTGAAMTCSLLQFGAA